MDEYKVLRCPDCGQQKIERADDKYHCVYCGCTFAESFITEQLAELRADIEMTTQGLVDEAMKAQREEHYYNLRSNLWELMHAEYTDSDAIIDVCTKIKEIAPSDFLADFYYTVCRGNVKEIAELLNNIDVEAQSLYIDRILDFILKSVEAELVAPINYLIERAYRNTDLQKFTEYITRLEEEATKVDSGIYETVNPRDVFLAYSSKDTDAVLEVMDMLEEEGFTCFCAMRNLRHGKNAVANYETELKNALDNCKIIVFVSSKNSRSFSCDALKVELPYIKAKEQAKAPIEYQNNYAALPEVYKMKRIEYRIDNAKTVAADIFLKEFFSGLDYCETKDKLLSRVVEYTTVAATAPIPLATSVTVQTAKKPQSDTKLFDIQKGILCTVNDEYLCANVNGKIVIPEGVKAIGRGAFKGKTGITEVIVNDGCQTISAFAFAGCTNLKRVHIPKTVKKISNTAFTNVPSLKIYTACDKKPKSWGGILSSWNPENRPVVWGHKTLKLFDVVNGTAVRFYQENLFDELGGKVVIPEGVKAIAEGICTAKEKITEVVFNDECEKIGPKAFLACPMLKKVRLPKGLSVIEEQAFGICRSLVEVKIPSGTRIIENEAFYSCDKLENVYIPKTVEEVGEHAFSNASDNLTVYAECEAKPAGWSEGWNPQGYAVKWGYGAKK